MEEKKSLWKFGTREVVNSAIGAALYGVLSFATNFLQLPSAGNVAFRPAVAIPCFLGLPLVHGWVSSPVSSAISSVTCSPVTDYGSGGTWVTASWV